MSFGNPQYSKNCHPFALWNPVGNIYTQILLLLVYSGNAIFPACSPPQCDVSETYTYMRRNSSYEL